jgi:CubicO group peptidase (beta-lactamase class C family)
MPRVPLLVAILCLITAALAYADPTDAYVNAQIQAFNLPGLSLAVIRDGAIVKSAGYGMADRERKVPATPDTVYKIGSVSKQFVAAGIMLLGQENRLALDDPVKRYLDKTPSSWSPITIRHLLTHTSGLVRESPAFSPNKNLSGAELLAAVYAVPLRFAPGAKWEYSNTGYVALAEIIRKVAHQPWPEYLHQKIFAPAGMIATLPTNTTDTLAHRAAGYTGDDNQRQAAEWTALRASGAFLSTVRDLAKWDSLLYTNNILSDASRRQMWTAVRLTGGSTAPYGFGWHVDSTRRGGRRIWHGGALPGFTSHFVRYLGDRLSVIVLSNGDDSDMGSIANGVAALYQR